MAALLLVGLTAAFGGTVEARGGEDLPVLQVEAPESLRSVEERLLAADPELFRRALDLVGLEEAGAPMRVILAPEGSPLAQRVPEWVNGYAHPDLSVIVLLPARLGQYPNNSLEEVLVHEVAHVLIGRAAKGAEVPRWFHEGVAMAAAGEWRLGDRTQLALALVQARRTSLYQLGLLFNRDARSSARAYALSAAFLRHVTGTYGDDAPARILHGLAAGERFPEAFRQATGAYLGDAEERFWSRETFWVRWLPVVSSPGLLWIGISLLAILAIQRRRARNAERMREWEEEERWDEVRTLARDRGQVGGGADEELVN